MSIIYVQGSGFEMCQVKQPFCCISVRELRTRWVAVEVCLPWQLLAQWMDWEWLGISLAAVPEVSDCSIHTAVGEE